jgi:hypothetical protein
MSPDKQQELTNYLLDRFRKAVDSRKLQMDDKYRRWLDNYSAKPHEAVRTAPWYRASNFVPQLIRMHCDILTARMMGVIFGVKPFWKPVSVLEGVMSREHMQALSMWLEYETFQRLDFTSIIHSGLARTFKTGTNIYKSVWRDPGIFNYSVAIASDEGDPSAFDTQTVSNEGLQPEAVPYDDFFVYPITVDCLEKTQLQFHRLRLSKEDVEIRKASGLWDEEATDHMLTVGGNERVTPAKESQADEAGIILTKDVVLPFTAVEGWFTYEMNGTNYRLVAIINPDSVAEHALLRLYFNYDKRGDHPFIDQRAMPREDFFYGYSVPEILESAQEEQAQIHNARRDANTIANMPGWKKKRMGGVPNPATDWYPGKVFELDDMGDLEPLGMPGNYNSMIDEEAFILELTNKYTGIGPAQQAFGSGTLDGKRGVYNAQGTMAMLSEGNQRLDLYLKMFRRPFHKFGEQLFRSNRDYRSEPIPFSLWGPQGELLQQVFNLPEIPGYPAVFFAIAASDGSANKEIDRTNLLLMANTLAGYYNQLFQAASVVTQMEPDHPLSEILLQTLDGAKDLADRLLFVFDIGDRNKLIPDIRNILGGGTPGAGTLAGATEQAGGGQPPGNVPVGGLQALSQRIAELPGRGAA